MLVFLRVYTSQEHGVISFEFDSGGPSRIEAWVPHVSSTGVVATWQPDSEANSMEARVDAKELDQLLYLQNKTPKWDEAHRGHVLNFQVEICFIRDYSVHGLLVFACTSLLDLDLHLMYKVRHSEYPFS